MISLRAQAPSATSILPALVRALLSLLSIDHLSGFLVGSSSSSSSSSSMIPLDPYGHIHTVASRRMQRCALIVMSPCMHLCVCMPLPACVLWSLSSSPAEIGGAGLNRMCEVEGMTHDESSLGVLLPAAFADFFGAAGGKAEEVWAGEGRGRG